MKRIKVMAYVMSTGLWDAFGNISLKMLLGFKDEHLEKELADWHARYDDQFKKYPYDFDWDEFNQTGKFLTEQIRQKLPPDTTIFYEPSDDREFFRREDCEQEHSPKTGRARDLSLRERKRSLLSSGIFEHQ